MLLHTKKLFTDYWKMLNAITVTKNVQEEYFFIDPMDKCMYFTNGNIAMKLGLELEGSGNILIIPKGEFLHVLKFSEKQPIELFDDHSYKVNSKTGQFNTNEKFIYMLNSIKAVFVQKFDFNPYFRFSPLLWTTINKATLFVNPDDTNPQYQSLHIKNNSIASSSMMRIYLNKNVNFEYEAILNSLVLRYMSFINPELTSIYKSEKSLMMTDGTLSLIFSNVEKSSYLPIYDEKFDRMLQSLFSSVNITFDLPSLLEGLNYIYYYSKFKINNCAHIFYEPEEACVYIEVDTNKVKINIKSCDGDLTAFDFFFNTDTLIDILGKGYINQLEEITLYCSTSANIYGLQPSANEYILLGKIINN